MQDRPWFLWDVPITDAEFRQRLNSDDPDIRAQWQGVLMREATFDEVWTYLTLDQMLKDYPRIRRHLGRARAFWDFTIEGWQARGLLPEK